ncbi:MAG: prephenate dehydrogenase/arogenate dehydrogenase family protein [Planctomycetes bacterium]|nr:prephenate dehydrogenase/arogenate dehydrogenase family protein [Planctomycetota bacterium]
MFHTITIVGAGLIGGSIGLAAKRRGVAKEVRGLGRSAQTLESARRFGAIDAGFLEPALAVMNADLVVVCTPVDRIAAQVLEFAPLCRPGCLLTDAGSTKAKIVAAVEENLSPGVAYVGSHPLAGSEKRGVENSDANLFQDRLTVVTPTSSTDIAALEKTCAFWRALGSGVKLMDPNEHDRALALTSHLPHLVAAALTGLLPKELCDLTATGFRDATRIAAGNPELWSAIFEQNRDPLLVHLRRFEERLDEFRAALENHDDAALRSLLAGAKEARDALGS